MRAVTRLLDFALGLVLGFACAQGCEAKAATKSRPKPNYVYNATAVSIYDGDTFDARIDLGLDTSRVETIRINGIDCPEIKGTSPEVKRAAKAAKAELVRLLGDRIFSVQTVKLIKSAHEMREKYGRYMGSIVVEADGGIVDVGAHMIAKGFCKPYSGGTR